jgi:hypothetical protein
MSVCCLLHLLLTAWRSSTPLELAVCLSTATILSLPAPCRRLFHLLLVKPSCALSRSSFGDLAAQVAFFRLSGGSYCDTAVDLFHAPYWGGLLLISLLVGLFQCSRGPLADFSRTSWGPLLAFFLPALLVLIKHVYVQKVGLDRIFSLANKHPGGKIKLAK